MKFLLLVLARVAVVSATIVKRLRTASNLPTTYFGGFIGFTEDPRKHLIIKSGTCADFGRPIETNPSTCYKQLKDKPRYYDSNLTLNTFEPVYVWTERPPGCFGLASTKPDSYGRYLMIYKNELSSTTVLCSAEYRCLCGPVCDSNTFLDIDLYNVCTACPAGHTCDGMTGTACSRKKYVNANACVACPAGHTCDGNIKTACDTNNYVNVNVCTACPAGHTCDGKTKTACDPNKYVNANVCIACPAGHTCDGKTKTACDAKKFVNANVCTACPAGHTCDGKTKTACDPNKYVNINVCTACPAGHACDGKTKTACATNKYVNANICTACPGGHTCDGKTKTVCDPMKYVDANVCIDCPSFFMCDGTRKTVDEDSLQEFIVNFTS